MTDKEEAKRRQRKKLASQSRVVKVLQGLAEGRELNELGRERMHELVQRLRDGEDANTVLGLVHRGRPPSGYIRDRNFWRVVRVRELMGMGLKKDSAVEKAAQELGDVRESTLHDLYKVHWREAVRFLRIEADYAEEDAAMEQEPDTTDMPPPDGSEFKD